MEPRPLPELLESERLVLRRPREDDAPAVLEAGRRYAAREDLTLYLFERAGGALVGGSGLHRISRRVAERAGFELEGVLRTDVRHLGRLRDTAVYARIR
jgi:RimJ/RimL family protein N-acetyltransferase